MSIAQILSAEAELATIPMGPEHWQRESDLKRQKVECAIYKIDGQPLSFVEWLAELSVVSKNTGVDWKSDEIRHDYYEGQPEVWIEYYDGGDSPQDAIDSDFQSWEE